MSSTVWWISASSSWSLRDPVGERLVLLADIDEVAHLGEHVRERPAGQERLEQGGAIGVVGVADPFGEQRLALRELGLLGCLPRLEIDQLGIEAGQAAATSASYSAWTVTICVASR